DLGRTRHRFQRSHGRERLWRTPRDCGHPRATRRLDACAREKLGRRFRSHLDRGTRRAHRRVAGALRMSVLPIIIDTDPGLGEPGSDIDDGLAILYALQSPELDVLALTVVNGNVDASTGTDVARRLLNRLGRDDIPVLRGAAEPLTRDMAPVRALFEGVLG